ncbi:DNA alkylation repair protein [Flavobacterium sp. EDS]|uniref:DNA alkylation repair protein n=1 Tax=Flavobacterium sp. EDS TaxID=2897328 RepID=UPI001E44D0E4|nr:DNA alkylation repair protein [Flavobacterium sp. EDS]MCD0475539.1 DNA alkylation repair protein [Flavobacterium sp. EDS]
MTEIKRKGSRSTKDIPVDILDKLNKGEIETANLVEWLAIDQKLLLKNVLQQANRSKYLEPIITNIEALKKQTVNTINETIGTSLFRLAKLENDSELFTIISAHKSDLVRCWATYTIGKNAELSISEMLDQIQPFAADNHFGVREICWLAVRPSIAKNLNESLTILSEWTKHSDQNIRRFASEATRPRGVWCEHLEILKHNPELGLIILEPLKSDNAKYVQDSIGNWLNDASKSDPDFVIEICKKWKEISPTKQTTYIVKKALRTIEK